MPTMSPLTGRLDSFGSTGVVSWTFVHDGALPALLAALVCLFVIVVVRILPDEFFRPVVRAAGRRLSRCIDEEGVLTAPDPDLSKDRPNISSARTPRRGPKTNAA
mgnify:CR=1 FL=1